MREVIVQGYRVMYRVIEDRILVLAVMHDSKEIFSSTPETE